MLLHASGRLILKNTGSAFVIALLTIFPGSLPSSMKAVAQPGLESLSQGWSSPLHCEAEPRPLVQPDSSSSSIPHSVLPPGHVPSHLLQTQLQNCFLQAVFLLWVSPCPVPTTLSPTQSIPAQSFIHRGQLSLAACRSGSVLGIGNARVSAVGCIVSPQKIC